MAKKKKYINPLQVVFYYYFFCSFLVLLFFALPIIFVIALFSVPSIMTENTREYMWQSCNTLLHFFVMFSILEKPATLRNPISGKNIKIICERSRKNEPCGAVCSVLDSRLSGCWFESALQ
jgi:hypothetical protein